MKENEKDRPVHIYDLLRPEEAERVHRELVANPYAQISEYGPCNMKLPEGKGPLVEISAELSGHLAHPARAYSVRVLESKEPKPDCWKVHTVGVFRGEEKIGQYERNYDSLGRTFAPFVQRGKHLALYSPDYTATRILSLPDCRDLGGEERDACGFCPVDYYVPIDPLTGECAGTGFVAGCIWGDDTSWKIQFLDLSRADEGVLCRDDRFGYIELPRGYTLEQAVQLERDDFGSTPWRWIRIVHEQPFDLSKKPDPTA